MAEREAYLSLLCKDCGETNHIAMSLVAENALYNCSSCGLALNLGSLKVMGALRLGRPRHLAMVARIRR